MKKPLQILAYLLFVQVGLSQTFEGTSNVVKVTVSRGIDAEVVKTKFVRPSGKYYALLIGVSKYSDPSLNLAKPEADAHLLAATLTTSYLFEEQDIKILLNPTREAILAEVYKYRSMVTSIDNLLIFYAGHGFWDNASQQGYWWPSDAKKDNPSNWISNSDLVEQIKAINSGHTLLISDACFSGAILSTRAAEIKQADLDIQLLYSKKSRTAITSGNKDEKVSDNSVFIKYIIQHLNSNKNEFLAASKLFDEIKTTVRKNSLTLPQIGDINMTGDEGGDFIFIRRK